MKILQFMPEFGLAGAETMCENLSVELVKRGHDVTVVSLYKFESPITMRLQTAGIEVVYLNKKPGLDFKLFFKVRKVIKRLNPDVIHTHRYVAQYVIPSAMFLNIKHKIHTVHNIAKEENTKPARILSKFFFHFCGVIPVALTEIIKDTIIEEYSLPEDKVPVIFNGVPLERCIVKESYVFNDNINILHIGRYSYQKNHIELIKAMMKLHVFYPQAKLILIGDGPLKCSIEKIIKQHNLSDYIVEVGLTNNPYTYLNNADIFVLPSIYEGMPMTLIEAMGTALPIVATNVGGIPDMITDKVNGILCESNSESIADALKFLLDHPEKRKQIGKLAKETSYKYSSSVMCDRYEKLYRNQL